MACSRANFTFTFSRILRRSALKKATDLSQAYAMTMMITMIMTMVKLISIVK
jgi:Zn-dependent membrane protease YugP